MTHDQNSWNSTPRRLQSSRVNAGAFYGLSKHEKRERMRGEDDDFRRLRKLGEKKCILKGEAKKTNRIPRSLFSDVRAVAFTNTRIAYVHDFPSFETRESGRLWEGTQKRGKKYWKRSQEGEKKKREQDWPWIFYAAGGGEGQPRGRSETTLWRTVFLYTALGYMYTKAAVGKPTSLNKHALRFLWLTYRDILLSDGWQDVLSDTWGSPLSTPPWNRTILDIPSWNKTKMTELEKAASNPSYLMNQHIWRQ